MAVCALLSRAIAVFFSAFEMREEVHALTKTGGSVPRGFSISPVRVWVVVHVFACLLLLNICRTKFILEKYHFGVAFLFILLLFSSTPIPLDC